jgi:HAD superfamily hydrolase (TIGR01484 family)
MMHFLALAADYDGTIAEDGFVHPQTVHALQKLKDTGRYLVLVTGRQLDELKRIFPEHLIFDMIVAENGALFFDCRHSHEQVLAPAPPAKLIEGLVAKGVEPLAVGRVVVATWQPHEHAVLQTIGELGLEYQLIFNKGAIMVLPSNINKAAGLDAALRELDISPLNVVAVGDAENDHSLLHLCGCSAAVANALPSLKAEAQIVLNGDHGAGVAELVDRIINEDANLASPERRGISVGEPGPGGKNVILPTDFVLIVGNSGCGKSSLATFLTEQMTRARAEFCVIDPEGDYIGLANAETVGGISDPPSMQDVLRLVMKIGANVVINAIALSSEERHDLFAGLIDSITRLRLRTGRPHWLLVDEAHHFLPSRTACEELIQGGSVLITLSPGHMPRHLMRQVDVIIALGSTAENLVNEFSEAASLPGATRIPVPAKGEMLFWRISEGELPLAVPLPVPTQAHNRHAGKYATGDIGDWHSFYFRGADKQINLRANNLRDFVAIARTIDPQIWQYHLMSGDYAAWFRETIKDDVLAQKADELRRDGANAAASRRQIIDAISCRYQL